jgi:hypothetical protein
VIVWNVGAPFRSALSWPCVWDVTWHGAFALVPVGPDLAQLAGGGRALSTVKAAPTPRVFDVAATSYYLPTELSIPHRP